MIRSPFARLGSRVSRGSFVSLVTFVAVAACLLLPGTAWAKYIPPPPPLAPKGHCVTTVGWLAPADVHKVDEVAEIARIQTGFVIDVLLATNDEPIDEIADETFKAWKPGDPGKDNGILLVLQPNFPKGQRKARLQVGKAVEAKISSAKGTEILRNGVGPLLNGSDQIRAAVAGAVVEISKALGADPTPPKPLAAIDAGAAAVASALPAVAAQPDAPPGAGDGVGSALAIVFGGFVVLLLGYVAFERFRPKGKGSGL